MTTQLSVPKVCLVAIVGIVVYLLLFMPKADLSFTTNYGAEDYNEWENDVDAILTDERIYAAEWAAPSAVDYIYTDEPFNTQTWYCMSGVYVFVFDLSTSRMWSCYVVVPAYLNDGVPFPAHQPVVKDQGCFAALNVAGVLAPYQPCNLVGGWP